MSVHLHYQQLGEEDLVLIPTDTQIFYYLYADI